MTKLSVNINKVATIRNARGGNTPNIVQFAIDCESFGADGITVHPRPDERHITLKDVYDLSKVVKTEFNIEGYPDSRYLKIIEEIKPAQATLVPDPPHVLTSNAGWKTKENLSMLTELADYFRSIGVRSSIFVDTIPENIEYAAKSGVDRIELYTEAYALQYSLGNKDSITPYSESAELAMQLDLGLNAGHDLSLDNIKFFKQNVPGLLEVSIGHALISESLYFGIDNVINMYLNKLK